MHFFFHFSCQIILRKPKIDCSLSFKSNDVYELFLYSLFKCFEFQNKNDNKKIQAYVNIKLI